MRSDATQIQRHLTWIFLEIRYYQYDAELVDQNLTRVMWLCREMPAASRRRPCQHMHSRTRMLPECYMQDAQRARMFVARPHATENTSGIQTWDLKPLTFSACSRVTIWHNQKVDLRSCEP